MPNYFIGTQSAITSNTRKLFTCRFSIGPTYKCLKAEKIITSDPLGTQFCLQGDQKS